jgi:hypothetical protein
MTPFEKAVDPEAIVNKIEEIITAYGRDGMISGVDTFTPKAQQELLLQLASLWNYNRIKYEQVRNNLQPYFGGVSKKAIDTEVEKIAEANSEDKGHIEHHSIGRGRAYRDYLSDLYGQDHQREINGQLLPTYPSKADLNEAIWQLEGHATRRGQEQLPELRIKYWNEALWLDLGGLDWKGVRITADGWTIVDRIDAPLVRGQGMQALPLPERGGNISALREFTNVRNDEDFALFCGTTAALFNRFGHYTTTIFTGPAGSGKTTATLVIAAAC